jgi:hypothetical protein
MKVVSEMCSLQVKNSCWLREMCWLNVGNAIETSVRCILKGRIFAWNVSVNNTYFFFNLALCGFNFSINIMLLLSKADACKVSFVRLFMPAKLVDGCLQNLASLALKKYYANLISSVLD